MRSPRTFDPSITGESDLTSGCLCEPIFPKLLHVGADTDLLSDMLAPPKKRAANRRLKRRQRAREKAGLRRCELWVSDRALEGIIRQFVVTNQLTDTQAHDHHNVEKALAAHIERQGGEWAR